MPKYDTIVYIGRLQPIHNVHAEIIQRACSLARELIIILGSANQPRTFKNPWTVQERTLMIKNVLDEIDTKNCRVIVKSNIDTIYNDVAWVDRIQTIVKENRLVQGTTAIIGHKKDHSTTDYLNMFPQWEMEDVGLLEEIHATELRDLYFNGDYGLLARKIPPSVTRFLMGWTNTPEYKQIAKEREYITKYKKQFESMAYPPIFVTVDAALIQSGHVLMIRRRSEPGKGLWALPGGFLNANTDNSIESAMLRELREETGIKVPTPVLKGNIAAVRVFDGINRSERGRVITHAHKIMLPDGPLPKVKGMDDADKAKWIPLSEVKSEECFDDHYEIIQWAINA